MNVKYSVNTNCELNVDVKDVKQAFQFLSYADDLFGVKKCGNCQSPNLRFDHRTPQGYEYYSITCRDCRHSLKFGQQKETGRLFPKGWEQPFHGEQDDQPRQNQTRRPAPSRRDESESFYDEPETNVEYDDAIAF